MKVLLIIVLVFGISVAYPRFDTFPSGQPFQWSAPSTPSRWSGSVDPNGFTIQGQRQIDNNWDVRGSGGANFDRQRILANPRLDVGAGYQFDSQNQVGSSVGLAYGPDGSITRRAGIQYQHNNENGGYTGQVSVDSNQNVDARLGVQRNIGNNGATLGLDAGVNLNRDGGANPNVQATLSVPFK